MSGPEGQETEDDEEAELHFGLFGVEALMGFEG